MSPSRRSLLAWAGSVLAFLLVLAWLPLGSAQAPPVIQVQVEGPAGTGTVTKSLGHVDMVFTISFLCAGGGAEPGDCTGSLGDQDVDVILTVPQAGAVPEGWLVTLEGDSDFTMKAKDTRAVTVRAKLETDEPDKDTFDIELVATATPNTDTLPLPGGPPNLGQSTTDSAAARVKKVITPAEKVLAGVLNYKWPLILGVGVLLVAGIVLSRSRRGGLHVASETPHQRVLPGRGVSFPIRIENKSRDRDRILLKVSHLPAGWASILPLEELEMQPHAETTLWVTVRSPADASVGDRMPLEVRAFSAQHTGRESSVRLEVEVGDGQAPASPPAAAPPGDSSSFQIQEELSASPSPKKAAKPRSGRSS